MARAECKPWRNYSDKEGLMWVVLWKDYFILQQYLWCTSFLGDSFKVGFQLRTDLIIVYIDLYSPDVHIVLEEFNLNLIFEFTRS